LSESLRTMTPMVVVFALLIGLMTWGFDALLERRDNPNLALVAGAGAPTTVVLKRNRAGRYVAPGRINGYDVTFLVDTGADHVAVPMDVARRIGLPRGQKVPVGTAGGVTTAYTTRLDTLTLGGLELRDVRGSITPAMTGDEVLLGMSFLRYVDFSKKGDLLIIEPPSR
jgi:aspartyl protease family protein